MDGEINKYTNKSFISENLERYEKKYGSKQSGRRTGSASSGGELVVEKECEGDFW
jgi:hypothetical protein